MKRLFILAISVVSFSGCASSRNYSSIAEPVGGTRAFDPIVSAPRNWSKPVKSHTTVRVDENEGARTIQGTVWERNWHGE